MSVHSKIREFREGRNLTHQQFADSVGVSRGAVQQWEKEDGTAPNRKRQPVVAQFMGISVEELMCQSTTPSSQPEKENSREVCTLEQSLEGLAAYLEGLDESDRQEAVKMLSVLSERPERHAKQAAAIRAMVGAPFCQPRSTRRITMAPKLYLIRVNPHIPQMGEFERMVAANAWMFEQDQSHTHCKERAVVARCR